MCDEAHTANGPSGRWTAVAADVVPGVAPNPIRITATADAPSRIKLFRLAFDTAVSSFSGRQQLYERYYSGDPVRLAGALYAMYPKDAPIARIHTMLDELEARSKS